MPAHRLVTDDQITEMVSLFLSGIDSEKLAVRYGISSSAVRKWLRKRGVTETDSRLRFTPEQTKELAKMYLAGESTIKLGKRFGVSPETVTTYLRKEGIPICPRGGYRYKCRDDAFDILTPEACYWIGMLITDGCITGLTENNVVLSLKQEDSDHVKLFRDFLGSETTIGLVRDKHPTDCTRTRTSVRVSVKSPHMVLSLAQYGVVPRKTHTAKAFGGVECSRDFWRGVVDGDGSVGIAVDSGPFVKLDSASEEFVTQFRDFLAVNGVRGTHSIISIEPDGSSLAKQTKYCVKFGARSALDAVALLYTNASVALPRKAAIAKEMIRRGIDKDLVGTFREDWYNADAAIWAGVPAN